MLIPSDGVVMDAGIATKIQSTYVRCQALCFRIPAGVDTMNVSDLA
jgi:hypothetical protein